MASIQSKKSKSGKRTYYVVVSQDGRHKWLRAGGLHAAKAMKREVESMQDSERRERLGFGRRAKRIDAFFAEYLEYVRLRSAESTVKRYRAAVNAFIAYWQLYQPRLVEAASILRNYDWKVPAGRSHRHVWRHKPLWLRRSKLSVVL